VHAHRYLLGCLLAFAGIARGAISNLTDVVELDVGGRHACVVTAAGGAKCWGDNTNGILGDGTSTGRAWASDVTGLASGVATVAVSKAWDGLDPGVAHSCALMTSGAVHCWGDNSLGQLGIGTATGFSTTPAAPVLLGGTAIAISAGWAHTCALMSDGGVRCWGANARGQLGDGTTADRSTPVAVAGLTGMVQVAAGPSHTCSMAPAGTVKCWGANGNGALGNGTTNSSSVPVGVAGLAGAASAITAGGTFEYICTQISFAVTCSRTATGNIWEGGHSCALLAAGGVQCWGDDYVGQLGDGEWDNLKTSPVYVSGLTSGAIDISAGGLSSLASVTRALRPDAPSINGIRAGHTCAVTAQGTVKCWGLNYCGILGDGNVYCDPHTFHLAMVPVDVVGVSGATRVAAGGEFACALSGGRVNCWGLGYGHTSLPVMAGTPPQPVPLSDPAPRLANISTRAPVSTGDAVTIAGFIIGGTGGSKTIAISVTGTALLRNGITNVMANPQVTVHRASDQSVVAADDNWITAAGASAVQESGFAPLMAADSAVLATLAPGAYTAVVSGVNQSSGTALVAVYEVDHPEMPLINISTRGLVQSGNDVVIGGFIIQGDSPKTVVVRARGPSLTSQGVPQAMQNPVVQLVRSSDHATLATNDDWQSASNADAIAASVFAPDDPRESAIMMTLPPGAYTAIMTAASGSAGGIGIVEVFAVD
jgi:alpha-tubulin suppressor-like RCC1 family protein